MSENPRVSTRRVYTGRVINLDIDTVRFPNGSIGELEMIRHPGASAVVPFVSDPAGDDPQVLLIRQYRHLQGEVSWELPGGGAQPGEDPLAAAQRELREEGGYRAERLEFLTRFYPSNAYLDEVAYCYAAYGLTHDPLPADDDEFIERRVVPLEEAIRMAIGGEITESVSKMTLLQYVARPPERS